MLGLPDESARYAEIAREVPRSEGPRLSGRRAELGEKREALEKLAAVIEQIIGGNVVPMKRTRAA
jgi:hypothetical protein